ncbi:MAG: hypothetical protein IJF63_04930 [Alistipes sp.]|nr:hypothetical protein [Alistipes sp.]
MGWRMMRMREGHESKAKEIAYEIKEMFEELCEAIEEESFGQRDFDGAMGGFGERGGYGQRDGGYGERRRRR